MIMRAIKKSIFLFTILISFIGCSSDGYKQEFSDEIENLVVAIDKKDWDLIYKSKNDKYKKMVSLKVFKEVMSRDSEITKVLSYKISDLKIEDNKAAAVINYKIKSQHLGSKETNYKDYVIFTRDNSGGWKLYRTGLSVFFDLLSEDLSN